MRTLKLLFAGSLLGLLGACASDSQHTAEGWQEWRCDSQALFQWRYANGSEQAVDLRLGGDDIVHRLKREVSGNGAMYSNRLLSFHLIGDQAVLYRTQSDDLIGRGCKALD